MGGGAPTARAKAGAQVEAGSGSSSTMLTGPDGQVSAATAASAASATCRKLVTSGPYGS
ncbi:MAG TPA: hypothetical protein VFF46_21415 [Kribbella sp.]|nr:hypothetical protein [Kribbella sp.]